MSAWPKHVAGSPHVDQARGRVSAPTWTKRVAGPGSPRGLGAWPGRGPRVDRASAPTWTGHMAGSLSPCALGVFAHPFTQQRSLGGRQLSAPVTCAARNPGRAHSRTRCFQSLRTFTPTWDSWAGGRSARRFPQETHRAQAEENARCTQVPGGQGQALNPGAVLLLRTQTLPEIRNVDVTASRQRKTRP